MKLILILLLVACTVGGVFKFDPLRSVIAESVFLDRMYYLRKDGQMDVLSLRNDLWTSTLQDVASLAQSLVFISANPHLVGPDALRWIMQRLNRMQSFNKRWIFEIDFGNIDDFPAGMIWELFENIPALLRRQLSPNLVAARIFSRVDIHRALALNMFIDRVVMSRKLQASLSKKELQAAFDLSKSQSATIADSIANLLLNPVEGTGTTDEIVEVLTRIRTQNSDWEPKVTASHTDVSTFQGCLVPELIPYALLNA
jgi:hypothetical protein